jgi:hypothetical protein
MGINSPFDTATSCYSAEIGNEFNRGNYKKGSRTPSETQPPTLLPRFAIFKSHAFFCLHIFAFFTCVVWLWQVLVRISDFFRPSAFEFRMLAALAEHHFPVHLRPRRAGR